MDHVNDNDSALHVMGLLSDGGVHSHYEHMFAILKMAKEKGLDHVYVHAFLDGRDVNQESALEYVEESERQFEEIGIGEFATVSGRYYAMDRDQRWDREEVAYQAISNGEGPRFNSAAEGIQASYDEGIYDEFVKPFVIFDHDGDYDHGVMNDDAVIFYNFRPDRAAQLSEVYTNEEFMGFEIDRKYSDLRSEEHTSELQSRGHLVCRLLLEKKKQPH